MEIKLAQIQIMMKKNLQAQEKEKKKDKAQKENKEINKGHQSLEEIHLHGHLSLLGNKELLVEINLLGGELARKTQKDQMKIKKTHKTQ